MKITRENFLNDLEMVKAGLSPREMIQQSSCFIFQDGMVMTFNDEVACRKEIGIQSIEGAVQATALLAILGKLDDENLRIRQNEKGELEFRGKSNGFGVTMEKEIFLPIDKVEMPEKWKTLPKEFTEAIGLVQHCVSTDETRFDLKCIHLHPEWIEACDNHQIMRCHLETGLKSPILVQGTSLAPITDLAMDKYALTSSWIHFKNQSGLIYSCRRYDEKYPEMTKNIQFKGHTITIPKGMAKAAERAAVFAQDRMGDPLVSVYLSQGRIKITGDGLAGWYKEMRKINYDGPSMEFLIAPNLLKHVSERYSDAVLTPDKLKVEGGGWVYVTVLGRKEDQPEQKDKEETSEEKE